MGEKAKHYDLIVIGAGSGLDVAVAAAERYGWTCAVVEEGPMGGTCLNRGCIPSKILIHAAHIAETIKNAETFGINAKIHGIDFEKIVRRATDLVDAEATEIEHNLRQHPHIDLYKVRGEFIAEKTLKVGGETISADKILLAVGSRAIAPPIANLDKIEYITSDEALRLKNQPKHIVIVGGGYIAVELGHFFGGLGSKVTIIERAKRLVDREDDDVAEAFTRLFAKKYDVALNAEIENIEQKGEVKTVYIKTPKSKKRVRADALLVAVGRRPNTDWLKLENTKIALDERGYVKVNEYMETSEPNVWALGDAVGKAPFKHGANFEAKHVFINLKSDRKIAVDYGIMPHAIFSSPQVAGVGLTEQEAKAKKIHYAVTVYPFIKTGMGQAMEEQDGFVKFILDAKGQTILGCHILGAEAATLIHEVVVAMQAGAKVSTIKRAIHIHPALSEVIQRAL